MELLSLNDVPNRLWDGRRFEFFFDGGVIGLVEISELISDPYNEGEGTFDQEHNGSHLG